MEYTEKWDHYPLPARANACGHTYKYGMVIKCIDGIERQDYPCIFTYSADYPEK
jgi:hypothetical protein